VAAPSAGVGHGGLGVPDDALPMDLPEFPTSGARDLIRHECEGGTIHGSGISNQGTYVAGPMYAAYREAGLSYPTSKP